MSLRETAQALASSCCPETSICPETSVKHNRFSCFCFAVGERRNYSYTQISTCLLLRFIKLFILLLLVKKKFTQGRRIFSHSSKTIANKRYQRVTQTMRCKVHLPVKFLEHALSLWGFCHRTSTLCTTRLLPPGMCYASRVTPPLACDILGWPSPASCGE